MQESLVSAGVSGPGPDLVVAADSTARTLLAAASRALRGADCADLDHHPVLTRFWGAPEAVRRPAVVRAGARAALPAGYAGEVDAELVARWVVDHYPPRRYPGLVVGSAHGAAVHLAVALGVPWLPAGFEMSVGWPEGAVEDAAGALAHGAGVAGRLVAANPDIAVRQVHDPARRGVLAGTVVDLIVRWRRLPRAYRDFLRTRVVPGAPVLLLRDARTWPVLDPGRGHSFQVGGPGSGLDPGDFDPASDALDAVLRGAGGDRRRWDPPGRDSPVGYAEQGVEPEFEADAREVCGTSGSPLHRVLFPRPEALSAAVADIYRSWLRSAGKTGDRCVVECGRLIDPWQVVRAGLVPYWCESSTVRAVTGAEWWLAGSAPFSSVDVLPEPPGLASPVVAGLPQWLAVASFGRRRRAVDRLAARGYPVTGVPTRRATEVLRGQPRDLPAPPPLGVLAALSGLRVGGTPHGLLVC
ncbi:hypothetical protein [Plantactinospora sp. GCM10030261]|uniref:hypothetical protein n=1 Tax=Plantactinospora sp. GCM10030261 TaxID=3273420 RepID=UPI00361B3836